MERRIPKVDVVCHGRPREFGEQLGAGLRDRIVAATNSLAELETFRTLQPWWLPFDWFQQWSEWRAMDSLQEPIAQEFPHIAARIAGMADGAQVRPSALYLFHMLEAMVVAPEHAISQPPLAACSAVAVPQPSTTVGSALLAHNLDGVDLLGASLVLRENRNAGKFRSLSLTCAPLSGTIDGINERGLAITYNWAYATDRRQAAAPVSVAIDDALANCGSVENAAARIIRHARCGGALLMLGDATGRVAALELSNQRHSLRSPQRNRPLFHSNQYRSRAMHSIQIAPNAIYAHGAPKPLVGRRVLQSPQRRDHRLRKLLREVQCFSPQSLSELLADHGDEQAPNDETICMHGAPWSTQAQIQLIPAQRSIRISYGPACEARFVDFVL